LGNQIGLRRLWINLTVETAIKNRLVHLPLPIIGSGVSANPNFENGTRIIVNSG
jgi:hypothetical protein